MSAYFIDGQIFFLDDSSAEELANRKFSPPDLEALKAFYHDEASDYCDLLGTEIVESDCTPEGVARLKRLYDQMTAERRVAEMFSMLAGVKQDAINELAHQQFEAMIADRSRTKET